MQDSGQHEHEPAVATALVRRLEGEREQVGAGAIAIDTDAALRKLGSYQLADPYAYVLRLVEAATLLGARELWFWTGPSRLDAHFVGDDEALLLDAQTLARLLEILVGGARRGARRQGLLQLAVAANVARGLDCSRLWIDSIAHDGRGHRLALEQGEQLGQLSGGLPGLWFRLTRRDPKLLERLPAPFGTLREAELLRARASWARLPIYIDNHRISHGFSLANHVRVDDERGESIGIAAVISRQTSVPAELILCANGVEVSRVSPPDLRPGFIALLDASHVPRDLSLSEFAAGPQLDALIESVHRVEDRALALTPERGSLQHLAPSKTALRLRRGLWLMGPLTFSAMVYAGTLHLEALMALLSLLFCVGLPLALLYSLVHGNLTAKLIPTPPRRLLREQLRKLPPAPIAQPIQLAALPAALPRGDSATMREEA